MQWTQNLIPLAPFAMIIAIVGFGTFAKRARDRHRAELQKELLAKFSSAQELTEFMKTDAGKLLMPEPARARTPAHRAGAGILVTIIGSGILFASHFAARGDDSGPNMKVAGMIVIAAGIGLLISAIFTHLIARKWGEQNQQPR